MLRKIGIIIENSFDRYQQLIIAGLKYQAECKGLGVHIFDCNSSDYIPGDLRFRDIMYQLIDPDGLDGLVLLPGTLMSSESPGNIEFFCKTHEHIPMLSLSIPIPGLPAIVIDNHKGMMTMMHHLSCVRGFRRIGFIRGPLGNAEAEERFSGYRSGLEEAGILYDPNLVFPGMFKKESGHAAVLSILQRELQLDALLAADDYMAVGALEAFQEHGIQVPRDIALAGFDDLDLTAYTQPPLTTMRQPIFEMGERAVLMLEQIHNGKKVPALTCMNVNLIIRESCALNSAASVTSRLSTSESGRHDINQFHDLRDFQKWIAESTGIGIDEMQHATRFAEHFRRITALCYSPPAKTDYDLIYDLFYESLDSGISVSLWQTILQYCMEASRQDGTKLSRELFRASADVSQHRLLLHEDKAATLRRTGDRLINIFSHEDIKNMIGAAGIANSIHGIVGLFSQKEQNAIKIYIQLEPQRNRATEGLVIPLQELFPGGAFEIESRNCIYLPLYKDGSTWGLAVFGLGHFQEEDLAVLTDKISRAVAGAELMQQVQAYTEELEETVARRTSELLQANQRLQENSYTDDLSGLRNRRFLRDVVEPEACRIMNTYTLHARRTAKRKQDHAGILYGILLLDIDHFKKVNDRYGHDSGDIVIQEFSSILRSSVRESDTVIRYGGEEFIIILKDLKQEFLPEIAAKIRQKVELTPFQSSLGNALQLSCSIGGSFFPPSEVQPEMFGFWDAITLGDLSLYYAKEHGRNKAVILEIFPAFFQEQNQKLHSADELERAVRKGLIGLNIR
ncbi:diguanylate cyclase [Spirochaeta dissipatitropha]